MMTLFSTKTRYLIRKSNAIVFDIQYCEPLDSSSTSQQADNGLTDAISECEAARPFEVDLSRINKHLELSWTPRKRSQMSLAILG